MLTCFGDVFRVVGRAVGGSFGGFDIDETYVFIAAHLFPIDFALVAGDVNAIVLCLGVACWDFTIG